MRVTLIRLFAVAVMAAVVAPVSAAPVPGGAGDTAPLASARKALDTTADYSYENRTLIDVVEDIKSRSKIDILIDPSIAQTGLDQLPAITANLKQARLRDALKTVLAPFNLRFGLIREGLVIATEEGVTARQLRQRVTVDVAETGFTTALKKLGDDTGANLVLDPRLGEKAAKPVTLKLDDVPLETAVRLLAEVADLRAVRMNNVLFVTTPERAEKLRPDADGPVPAAPPGFPNVAVPFGGIGFGFGGGVRAVPPMGGPAPAPVPLPPMAVPAPAVERPILLPAKPNSEK